MDHGLDNLAPLLIGQHGQLQEYLDDWDEPEPAHRHVSHLYGIFPGNYPTTEDSADLFEAARTSLVRRLEAGGGHTGWSRSWVAALWARFGDGDLASEHFDQLIAQFATDALLDLHPPRIFQIDGNFGGTAAVAEMLLQSHWGVIHLLPALPRGWTDGSISGLRARGQRTIAITWEDGLLLQALIVCGSDAPLMVQLPDDRDYTVTARTFTQQVEHWGADEFAHVSDVAETPVETSRVGNRLAWTPNPSLAYRIDAA